METTQPSPYQVIARKYRPQTFSHVASQESIVTTLKNAIKHHRLAHAYLFCGCRGTGKTTLARVFAKALNCKNPTEEMEPCNSCSSCQEINAGRSLSVFEIDGASNRGIDDIRQINETIGYALASERYKIYIIDEVHMLTKEAFNALLKTLEEPPERVKFFFATTEPHKVPSTILSRCQRFDLNRIPFEEIKKKLAWIATDLQVPCEEEVLSQIAHLSEGSLRDAESLLDQVICCAEPPITLQKASATLGILPHSAFFSLDKAFHEQTPSYAFELAGDIFSSGKDLSHFIDHLIEHYRCTLKLKLGAPTSFPTQRLKEHYNTSQLNYTEEQLLYILDFLIHWQQQISKTPFKRVTLETILLHIIRSKHRLTLPALIRRLHALEQQLTASPQPKESPAPLPVAQTPVVSAPAPEEVVPPEVTQIALEPPIEAISPDEEPSLEETLIKKIQQKIDAAPAFIEDSPQEETSTQPFPLLSRATWEAKTSEETIAAAPLPQVPETPLIQSGGPPSATPASNPGCRSRYDTLMRFAAVELEGIIKKENNNG